MKIVRNDCFGGFGLSTAALKRLSEITGKSVKQCYDDYRYGCDEKTRTAPELVQVVEELGDAANDSFANLIIVNVPDDVQWIIEDNDGWESVEEIHRSW